MFRLGVLPESGATQDSDLGARIQDRVQKCIAPSQSMIQDFAVFGVS